MNKSRYAMTMDTRRCVGCHACVYACKAENDLPENGFRDWITVQTKGRFPNLSQEIRSDRCNHCENLPCVSACPTGASHVGQGGTVLVTKHKCTGCKACIAACPYDARYVHEDGYADKCTFCLHRVSNGQPPACVQICPTAALNFGDKSQPSSAVSQLLQKRRSKVAKGQLGLKPQLHYLR